ncbi:hypothetical protein ATZ33_01860 [Enterococcus silesiacus]|uniref:Uncharacterized protein n=1 Tax=Enterococcus silesiacus TaxID=332949 RepID=A0A0S3K7D2_9ENTE|nr:hypothetical protein [Enterococcus silesiacus]ALS00164.1 hypothetical protein ATZ33_01860 [Enterococcus silesiacus]OJG84402.1 hypothetical protein RV15_GL003095 [Enterococcus silesiacus]
MNEEWKSLNIADVPKGEYELEKVTYDTNGTIIELGNDDIKLIIDFHYAVILTRYSDESQRWKTTDRLLYKYGKDFFKNSPLFIIENSDFADWLEKESFGVNSKKDVTHYCIYTPDDVVDILSLKDPEIRIEKVF